MKKLFVVLLCVVVFSTAAPNGAAALTIGEIMPGGSINPLSQSNEAKAYAVIDRFSGEILLSKNPDMVWPPASLTKLMTALVFMDSKTSLNKTVSMTKADEVGGQRLPTKVGVKYAARDLLHAALIASDNNAASALARSTGLTNEQFIAAMNKKAAALGALHTQFYEPTGMNPKNYTTALDYAKIINAALSNSYIGLVAKKSVYTFAATNNKKYTHTLKSTNKLLSNSDFAVLGGKTGFLEESQYNFAAITRDQLGNEFIIVVLGAPNPTQQFAQTRQLAYDATALKVFGAQSAILGASTSTQATSTFLTNQ